MWVVMVAPGSSVRDIALSFREGPSAALGNAEREGIVSVNGESNHPSLTLLHTLTLSLNPSLNVITLSPPAPWFRSSSFSL